MQGIHKTLLAEIQSVDPLSSGQQLHTEAGGDSLEEGVAFWGLRAQILKNLKADKR